MVVKASIARLKSLMPVLPAIPTRGPATARHPRRSSALPADLPIVVVVGEIQHRVGLSDSRAASIAMAPWLCHRLVCCCRRCRRGLHAVRAAERS